MDSYKTDPDLMVEPAYYAGGVPVFEPTMAQFANFYAYNKAINKYGMQSGIVKVIPPVEWTQKLQGTYTNEKLSHVRIKNPIVQNMNVTAGQQGVFSLQNVERQRTYNMFQWKDLSMKANYNTPAKKSRRRLASPHSKSPEPTNTLNQMAAQQLLLGPFNIDVKEFTPARCEELEQLYWKSLGYAEPMYGADMLGSLFRDDTKCWNVAHLPNILDLMEEKIPGVNDAYLYAGLWKASFSWHLEDQDLYSINYLHFGAPKQWYSIPQVENTKFYNLMKEVFPEDSKNCLEFLRHKTFLASPQFLAKHGITCNSIVHNQGEFMITYPYGYHAGFNYGYNLAESVNFAIDDWFQFAPLTKKCECISDSVGINYRQLFCRFLGIPYGKVSETEKVENRLSPTPPAVRKNRRRPKEKKIEHECILCPNMLPVTLKRYAPFELVDTDLTDLCTGLPLQVHRICANVFNLKFKRASRGIKGTSERVVGISNIPRPARNLKCSHCHTPNWILQSKAPLQGACVQCSFPKCSRSFHATCGLAAGALFGKFFCKQHRSHSSPYYDAESPELRDRINLIPENSVLQFTIARGKRHVGDVYCGVVTGQRTNDDMVLVQIYPAMDDVMEVQYKDILIGKGDDNEQFMNMALADTNLAELRGMRNGNLDTTLKDIVPKSTGSETLARSTPPSSRTSISEMHELQQSFGTFNDGHKRKCDFIDSVPKRYPPTFASADASQPRLVNTGVVFINEYSDRLERTPEPGRFRFVEETFQDDRSWSRYYNG